MSHVSVTCAGDGGGPHPCIASRPPLPLVYGTAPAADPAAATAATASDDPRGCGTPATAAAAAAAADEAATGTIFVSVASFRDPECQHTLRDLFDTAKHPHRVVVGVVGQYDAAADAHCFTAAPLPAKWAAQVRCLSLPASAARGPCWARHWAMQLHRRETFYLQIDSHMRFRPNW
jgi:hypothetical protein